MKLYIRETQFMVKEVKTGNVSSWDGRETGKDIKEFGEVKEMSYILTGM